jgi:hypothetical protein
MANPNVYSAFSDAINAFVSSRFDTTNDNWFSEGDLEFNNNGEDSTGATMEVLFELISELLTDYPNMNSSFANELQSNLFEIAQNALQNKVVKFDPKKKFFWIATMMASQNDCNMFAHFLSKHEAPRDLILMEDKNGNSCLTNACFDNNCLKVLFQYIEQKDLYKENKFKITPMHLLIYSSNLTHLMTDNSVDLDMLTAYTDSWSFNAMQIACMFGQHASILVKLLDNEKTATLVNGKDCNGSNSLITSVINQFYPMGQVIIKSKYATSEMILAATGAGHNILSYPLNEVIFKDLMNCENITEEAIKPHCGKLTSVHFKDTKLRKVFYESKFFTKDLLTLNNSAILYYFLKNFMLEFIGMENENVKKCLIETFASNPNFLVKHFTLIKASFTIAFIKSDYMTEAILLAKSDVEAAPDLQTYILESLDKETYINALIESKVLTSQTISPNLLQYVCDNHQNLFDVLVSKKILSVMDGDKLSNIIINLFKKGAETYNVIENMFKSKLLDKSHLKIKVDNYPNLLWLNANSTKIIPFLVENDIIDEEVLNTCDENNNSFVVNCVKEPSMNNETFKLLLLSKIITDVQINNINKDGNNIVHMIGNDVEKLNIILNNRPFFDRKLMVAKNNNGISPFIMAMSTKAIELQKFISSIKYINIEDGDVFTEEDFSEVFSSKLPSGHKMEDYLPYLDKLTEFMIGHKYFNETYIAKKHNGNNMLHRLIGRNSTCVKLLIDSPHMKPEYFEDCNEIGDNILLLALKYNRESIKPIINSKYFSSSLILNANKDDINALSLVYEHYDKNLIRKIIDNGFADENLLKQQFTGGNTIIHKMLVENAGQLVMNLIESTKTISILLTRNDNKDTPLHIICNTMTYDNLELLLLYGLTSKELLIQNTLLETPFSLLIKNKNLKNPDFLINFMSDKDLIKEVCKDKLLINLFLEMYPEKLTNLIKDNLITDKVMKYVYNSATQIFKLVDVGTKENIWTLCKTKHFNQSNFKLVNGNDTLILYMVKKFPELLNDFFDYVAFNTMIITERVNDAQSVMDHIVSTEPKTLKEIIVKDNLFTKELFIEYLGKSITDNLDSFNILIGSKYFAKEYLNEKLQSGETLIDLIMNNKSLLQRLLSENLLGMEIIDHVDMNGDLGIIYLMETKSFDNVKQYIKDNHFNHTNNCGQTLLHQIARTCNFDKIMDLITPELAKSRDAFGMTCLDHLIESGFYSSSKTLLESKLCTKELMHNQDKKGMNCLMKASSRNKELANHIVNMEYCNSTLLSQTDFNGNTTVNYLVMHLPETLTIISKKVNSDVFNTRNFDGMTIAMTASKHNTDSLKFLIKSKLLEKKHTYTYANSGSCLTYSARYNPTALAALLSWDGLTNDLLKVRHPDRLGEYNVTYNCVQMAAKYNPDSLRHLLNSKLNLKDLVEEILTYQDEKTNALKLAIFNEPDNVELLLNSKYTNIVEQTEELMVEGCLLDSVKMQPKSFVILLKSNKFPIVGIQHKLNAVFNSYYNNVDPKTDFYKKYPVMRYKNTPTTEDDPALCTLCYMHKQNVVYNPCGHKSCNACALRINECHECRTAVEGKLVYSDS